jgi:hypothetical protein
LNFLNTPRYPKRVYQWIYLTKIKLRPRYTSLIVVVTRYIWRSYEMYQALQNTKKYNRNTTLLHHENFRRRHRITSISANTTTTPGLPRSPSPKHHPRQSCRLVRSDSAYFTRNHTISTCQILLHDSVRQE